MGTKKLNHSLTKLKALYLVKPPQVLRAFVLVSECGAAEMASEHSSLKKVRTGV